jgi:integrase
MMTRRWLYGSPSHRRVVHTDEITNAPSVTPFGTILNANGENPKVIQELLGRATLKVTMDTYVQAVSDEKRNAQTKVVRMLLSGHSQGS